MPLSVELVGLLSVPVVSFVAGAVIVTWASRMGQSSLLSQGR